MSIPSIFTDRDRSMIAFTLACVDWRAEARRILDDTNASQSQRKLARDVLRQWALIEDSVPTAHPALRLVASK